MSIINSEPPSHYAERIRTRTVYPEARRFINIIFWLSIITLTLISSAGIIASFAGALKSENIWAILPSIGIFVGFIMYIYVLIFLKSVAVAYFDAVDVLIESNRRKKNENGA